MSATDLLDRKLAAARSAIQSMPIGEVPDLIHVNRRHVRRRAVGLSAIGVVCAVAFAVLAMGRPNVRSAADPNGIGTRVGDTPWRIMLLPDGWRGTLIDEDTTALTSAEGQKFLISAIPGERPATDVPVVVGPLVDGYSTGSAVFVERMGWTLEVALSGTGTIDESAAVWLLQTIGRVDVVAPYPDAPLPAEIPDVIGLDYETATDLLINAGVRSEWSIHVFPEAPLGTVQSIERRPGRLLLVVAAAPFDFDLDRRFEASFTPERDVYLMERWGRAAPFGSRPPYVFLSGEFAGTAEQWSPNSSSGFITAQSIAAGQPTAAFDDNGPLAAPAETSAPAPTTIDEAAPAAEPDLVAFGLALRNVPADWKVVDLRDAGSLTDNCPSERTILIRTRSAQAAPVDCAETFSPTLPTDWLVIEPLPASIDDFDQCSPLGTQRDGGPMIWSCESFTSFPNTSTSRNVYSSPSTYRFFNGIDAVVSGSGEALALELVYEDGHSDEEPDNLDFTEAARRDLDQLRAGGGGCAALAAHAEGDFNLAACEALGIVTGDPFPDADPDVVGSRNGIKPTNVNPQLDAEGTLIVLQDGDVESRYLLAHRFVFNPETLQAEWRIASIDRYTGPWPPPALLPGRPPLPQIPE